MMLGVALIIPVGAVSRARASGVTAQIANSADEVCTEIADPHPLASVAAISFGEVDSGTCAHKLLVLTDLRKRALNVDERIGGNEAEDFAPIVAGVAYALFCANAQNQSFDVPDCADFNPLKSGKTCVMDLYFCPKATGFRSARLEILGNRKRVLTLLVSGTGTGVMVAP